MIITVIGRPAPKGSYRAPAANVVINDNEATKPWQQAVMYAVLSARAGNPDAYRLHGPCEVGLAFYFLRPKSVKAVHMAVRPDIDKLQRSTLDALVDIGAIEDDARIVDISASKRYSNWTGARITITEAE